MRLNLRAYGEAGGESEDPDPGDPFAPLAAEERKESSPAPPVYVPPFAIVVDTREQAPFRFTRLPATAKECGGLPGGFVVPRLITGRGLPTGDYSIDGMEGAVCVERKSLADLFASVGRERDRFEREFVRMAAMRWSAVVVEASEIEVDLRRPRGSKIEPAVVRATVESWSVRYPKTHWFFPGDRRRAEMRTYRLLAKCWEVFRVEHSERGTG